MSNVRELAEQEAARAEAEQPDEEEAANEEETPPEPEPEPEPEPDTEAELKAFEREANRHGKAFAKLVGVNPDDLIPCPTCVGNGYVPEELIAPPEYRMHPNTDPCIECEALGWLQTGSKVPEQAAIICFKCGGAGYNNRVAPDAFPPQATVTQLQTPATTPQSTEDPAIAALKARGYTVLPPYEGVTG